MVHANLTATSFIELDHAFSEYNIHNEMIEKNKLISADLKVE
jgi:hypothetical protein